MLTYIPHNDEIEDSHRIALLTRIAEMKQAMWTEDEIADAVSRWPEAWQKLVANRSI